MRLPTGASRTAAEYVLRLCIATNLTLPGQIFDGVVILSGIR